MGFLLFMGFLLCFAFGFSVGFRIGDEPEEVETYRRGTEPKQKYEGYEEFKYDCLKDDPWFEEKDPWYNKNDLWFDEHIPRID